MQGDLALAEDGGFALHLAFVLLMLGSAVLGLTHLFRAWASGKHQEWELSGQFLNPFFVFKSIAIVLGIAPLLLIQVGYTIPFMTAGNLFAPL